MLRTGNLPRQSEGGAAQAQPRFADPRAAGPAPAPGAAAPHHSVFPVGAAGDSRPAGVTIKVEQGEEGEEGEEEGEEGAQQREGVSPGPTRVPASGPRAALAAAPAIAPHHDLAAGGARASGVTPRATLVNEEEAEEEARSKAEAAAAAATAKAKETTAAAAAGATTGAMTATAKVGGCKLTLSMKPILKAPGFKRLKLKYDRLLSTFAFNVNLRPYTKRKVRAASVSLRGVIEDRRIVRAAFAKIVERRVADGKIPDGVDVSAAVTAAVKGYFIRFKANRDAGMVRMLAPVSLTLVIAVFKTLVPLRSNFIGSMCVMCW